MNVKRKTPFTDAHKAQYEEIRKSLESITLEESMPKIKILETMLKELDFGKDPIAELDILMDIGVFYGQIGERETAERFFVKILSMAKKRSMKKHKRLAESNLAIIKVTSGKYPEAIGIWKGLIINEKDESIKQHLLNNISVAYGMYGNFGEAINHAFKALDLGQKIGDKSMSLAPYINLSKAYKQRGEKTKALDYVLKAVNIARELNDIYALTQSLNNSAVILNELDRQEEALVCAQENLELRLKYLAEHEHGLAYNNLGVIYRSTGRHEEALENFLQASSCFSSDGISENRANTILNIAATYSDLNNPDEAFKYFEKALPIVEELELNELFAKYYQHYSAALKQKGRYLEAYEAQVEHSKYLQKMYEHNLNNSINKSEADYYQNQIKNQAEAYKKQNLELRRKRKELKIANKNMQNTVEALNWLVSVISHDVRAPLANFGQILDMALSGAVEDGELPEILKAIRKSSTQIYDMVNEMLDGIRLQRRRLADSTDIEKQDLVPILHPISAMYQSIALHKGLKFRLEFESEEIMTEVDADLIKIVVRNLLNNAIKFTSAGGEINLKVIQVDGIPEIYISDTGKGMSPSELAHILKPGKPSSKKSLNSDGIGLGLSLCRDAIKKMKGSMNISSRVGKGTTINISLPPAF